MPLRVITSPGHSRKQSLGWLAVWWIETFTVHGPGDVLGSPVRYGDEYTSFVVDCYALSPIGRRLYDSAFFSRPKGCDKSGVAAALALFEALGPSRFAGIAKGGETYEFLGHVYTYAAGEPMGRRVKSPYIRIMATEETQTGNVFDTIYHNLTSPQAPLFELQSYGLAPGRTKIVLPWGGEIVPSTAGSASKDGGIETFVVFDETHLYVTPVLRSMFRTVSKNLRKRKQLAETWYLETTTMYAPGEESIAEETYNLAASIEEGRAKRARALFNHRFAVPLDLRNEDELAQAFREAYGEAIAWNSVESLIDGVFDTRQSESESRRYFFNSLVASANAWLQVEEWTHRGRKHLSVLEAADPTSSRFVRPQRGDVITLGFDGSRNNDATVLIGCRVTDRLLFPILIEEMPDGPEAADWEVDREKVDAAVVDAHSMYTVVGFFGDPPLWQDYVDKWSREFGADYAVQAGAKNSIAWWTERTSLMSAVLERLHTAIVTGQMSHDDETQLGAVMSRHFVNARVWKRRSGDVIGKEGKNSPKKIDGAIGGALAFEAAAQYVASVKKKPNSFVPIRVR